MTRFARLFLICTFVLFCSALLTPNIARSADENLNEIDVMMDLGQDLDDTPQFEAPEKPIRVWKVSLGVVAGYTPDYEGSNDYEFGWAPNYAITWRETVYAKNSEAGVNVVNSGGWKAGPMIYWESGRDEDDNDKLEGLGDVDSSTNAGLFIKYKSKPFRFQLQGAHDIGNGHEGTVIQAAAGFRYPFDDARVLLMFTTTFADDNYMTEYFSVNGRQSQQSGLEKYDADAGFKDVGVKLSTGYRLWRGLRIGAQVQWTRLIGDAGDSPIVDDENQFVFGIGLSYRFGSKKKKKGGGDKATADKVRDNL
jgi:outer membrane protein